MIHRELSSLVCAGDGITLVVMKEALEQAKTGRQHILREMQACHPPPAKRLSNYAPRVRRFSIDPDKTGQVIASGSKAVKMLQAAAGCEGIQVSCCCCHVRSFSSFSALPH